MFDKKVNQTVRGQKAALKLIKYKLEQKRSQYLKSTTVVWFHVSSAGEFLQAKPVIERLKKEDPKIFIVLTLVSPSGVKWTQNYDQADLINYYPLDTRKNAEQMLNIIKPTSLVFVKFDLWPNLILHASQMKVPIFLISATLTKASGRYRNIFARSFFKKIYDRIDHIFVCTEEDLLLFKKTNESHKDLRVLGDTRVDSVLMRQEEFQKKEISPSMSYLKSRFDLIVIVGSAWPEDIKIILPAWKEFILKHQKLRSLLVIVPHEPDHEHINDLSTEINKMEFSSELFSSFVNKNELNSIDVLVVDQVGLLADLYRVGSGAFVGSGRGGVHNTMEPAAWNLPVMFRPKYFNAPEAVALVNRGVFTSIKNATECLQTLEDWFITNRSAQKKGQQGREYFEKSKGSTQECVVQILEELRRPLK